MESIQVCVYCERTAEEVVADKAQSTEPVTLNNALQYVLVSGNRVLLCPDDRQGRPILTEEEQLQLLCAPLELPPGTTTFEHLCSLRLHVGYSEEEATVVIELVREGAYLVGSCRDCGLKVRSPVLRNREADPGAK